MLVSTSSQLSALNVDRVCSYAICIQTSKYTKIYDWVQKKNIKSQNPCADINECALRSLCQAFIYCFVVVALQAHVFYLFLLVFYVVLARSKLKEQMRLWMSLSVFWSGVSNANMWNERMKLLLSLDVNGFIGADIIICAQFKCLGDVAVAAFLDLCWSFKHLFSFDFFLYARMHCHVCLCWSVS